MGNSPVPVAPSSDHQKVHQLSSGPSVQFQYSLGAALWFLPSPQSAALLRLLVLELTLLLGQRTVLEPA